MSRIAASAKGRNYYYYRAGQSILILTKSTREHHPLSSSPSSCCCCLHTNSNTKCRVAVTGLGIISPLGHDSQSTWRGVLLCSNTRDVTIEKYNDNKNNNSMGITSLHSALQQQNLSPDQFEKEWAILQSLSCQVAASVPYDWIENHPHAHDAMLGGPSQSPPWLDGRTARFVQLALIAAQEAIYNSGLQDWLNSHDHHQQQHQQQRMSSTGVFHKHDYDYDTTNIMRESYGVSIGNGMSSTRDISMTSSSTTKNIRKISPHFVPQILPNSPAARIAIHHQLRGPNLSHSEACAAGAAAIAQAVEMIRWGRVKGMVAGGCESAVEALGLAGFSRLRALSSSAVSNDNATLSSRVGGYDNQHGEHNHGNHVAQTSSCPFDSKRNGFVLAEGAAMLVLEEYDHAVARGAPILAEVLGVGYSGDAFHITAPEPSGRGAAKAMLQSVEDAGRSMNCVDYINAHATSTPMGDVAEIHAIQLALSRTAAEEVPSNPLLVSSTKGATGHLLGAAGAIEAALTVMAISEDTAPHTRNLDEISDDVKQALEQVTDKEATSTSSHHRSIHLVKHEPISQTINAAISNSFGFGGTNVSLLFGKAK